MSLRAVASSFLSSRFPRTSLPLCIPRTQQPHQPKAFFSQLLCETCNSSLNLTHMGSYPRATLNFILPETRRAATARLILAPRHFLLSSPSEIYWFTLFIDSGRVDSGGLQQLLFRTAWRDGVFFVSAGQRKCVADRRFFLGVERGFIKLP